MQIVINKTLLAMEVIHALTLDLYPPYLRINTRPLRINGLPPSWKAIYSKGFQSPPIVLPIVNTCS